MAQSHDEPPSPPPLPVESGHANRDPLTDEPGAHPVGVGMGAASAGAVGALLGAVAGPVGALVGSVVGAITGAVVGKETAESVNPTEPSALARSGVGTVDHRSGTVAEEPAGGADAVAANVSPVSPLGVVSNDATLSYSGGAGALAYLATHVGADSADQDVPPEPTAEPPPPPMTPAGPRLRKIVLAGRPAPPPLEITAQTAYPEDNVRDAAYFRYLERQRTGRSGDELGDWSAAEREVLRG